MRTQTARFEAVAELAIANLLGRLTEDVMFAAVGGQHDGMCRQNVMLAAEGTKIPDPVFTFVVAISIERE